MVKKMLQDKDIQLSKSPFSSPVILMRKKIGDSTWTIGALTRLSSKTPTRPIPTIDKIFNELYGALFFSKYGIWRPWRLIEDMVLKMAFHTHDDHYEFCVMPFGFCNAPSTFQSMMNAVFKDELRRLVLVFFDDILLYSKD